VAIAAGLKAGRNCGGQAMVIVRRQHLINRASPGHRRCTSQLTPAPVTGLKDVLDPITRKFSLRRI